MTDPLWKLERVTLAGQPRSRLADVTVQIFSGITAVLGHSGAGKTSLLNLLVGFEHPDSGRVDQLFPNPADQLAVFWVPPDDGLWPHWTVLQHLETVASKGTGAAEHSDLLEEVDLLDKSGTLPDQLSQGERARLSVARALASQARVLVFDEPLVHVDPAGVGKYWEAVRTRATKSGTSIVFSTHSPEAVLSEAQDVVCLKEGRLVYAGRVEALYHNPPGPDVGWCLGPLNHLPVAESTCWFRLPNPGEQYLRPEQLTLTPEESSPLVVQSSRFAGSLAEVELLDERSGRKRRFYHRPAANILGTGDRVALKILALFLATCLLVGCGGAEAAPELPVKSTDTWLLPANGASVPAPRAVHAAWNGEIFVLDNAGRVLVYDAAGKLLRQWWMPEYSAGRPEKICLLKDGRLAVADTHYHRVVFFDLAGNAAGKFGTLGHAPGEFIYPVAVVEDESENLYVCEYGDNDRIQKFTKEGKFVLQFGRQGTGPGEFQRPSGIVWREGRVYVVDAFNNRIQAFSDTGEFLEVLGAGDDSAALLYPYDIAANSRGELYVVEYAAGRVSKFDRQGKLLGRFGSIGIGENQLTTPWGLAVDAQSRVYVADTGNRRVVQLEF